MSRFSLFIIFLFIVSLFPELIVAESSQDDLNINWENSGDITFLVESNQWFQFGIGINSTSINLETLNIKIIGETNWGIDDSRFIVKDQQITNNGSFELESNENLSLTVQVFIPEINNGTPLAETEYPFQLKLTNETGKNITWNYALSIRPKFSLTIDEIIERRDISPLSNSIHDIKIRNTGNIQTSFSSEISAINLQGEVIENEEKTRVAYLGWNATISGWVEELILQPNQSSTIQISINSPYEEQGTFSVQMKIKSNSGNVEENIYLNSSIEIQKNIDLELIGENCLEITNNEKCNMEIKLKNSGNFKERIGNISCISTSDFIMFNENNFENEINVFNSELFEIILEPNEDKMFKFNISTTISRINAGSIENIICTHFVYNSNLTKSTNLTLNINEFHNIIFENKPLKWRENNQLFICMEIENKGNTPESFSVGIRVSHEGNHGLITPLNSTFDKNSSRIRGYYIENILPNQKLNITGWMNIPNIGVQDELIWISIDINSVPDHFEKTWRINETIKGNSENNSNNKTINEIKENVFLNSFNTYGYPSIASLISIIIIIMAIKTRRNRNIDSNPSEQKNNDWMSTFFDRKETNVDLTSPEINKNEFKELFSKNKNSNKEYTTQKINYKQIEDESKKLEKRVEKNFENKITSELLDDLDENEYDF